MSDCGISKLDLKRRNRMQILRIVREHGPISRVDISAILQITRAAVTIITNEMIEQGILEEVGEETVEPGEAFHKGRRKILLDINEAYRFAAGIYIDEKNVSMGLTTINAAVMDKTVVAHDGTITPEQVLEYLRDSIDRMLQNSCLAMENLLGIGVGIMPSMFEAMEGEKAEDGSMQFSRLQSLLEEAFHLPVYIENAIRQIAMAGVTFREKHVKAVRQVMLYWNGESFIAVPADGVTRGEDDMYPAIDLSRLSIAPDGVQQKDYPRGSVHAEISRECIQKIVKPFFSPEQTPALYAQLEGDLSRLTLARLLTAMESDQILVQQADALLGKFFVLLNSLYTLYQVKYISLCGFGLSDKNMELLRQFAADFGGEDFSESLVCCPIQEKYRFLCGCVYAIQNGFFQRGGMM